MGKIEKRARELLEALEVLANLRQAEAARGWGETKEHATLQRWTDALHKPPNTEAKPTREAGSA